MKNFLSIGLIVLFLGNFFFFVRTIFFLFFTSENRQLRLSFDNVSSSWSSGFRIDSVNSFDVKIWKKKEVERRAEGRKDEEERSLVRVNVDIKEATARVTFAFDRYFVFFCMVFASCLFQ